MTSKAGRPPSYNWDVLLDGSPHTLKIRTPAQTHIREQDELEDNGAHTVKAFRTAASAAARRKLCKATIWWNGGAYVVIQAYGGDHETSKPKLSLNNVELRTRRKKQPPKENLCVVCGALVAPLQSLGWQAAQLPVQCWVMEGPTPLGPLHDPE